MLVNVFDEDWTAFDEGWVANSRCYGQCSNPYPFGTLEWEEWIDGWQCFRDYRPESTTGGVR